jgi:outer membrane lipoprotein SlyB
MDINMKNGTPVEVRRDDGDILRTVTRSEPWQLPGGQWIVLVEGIRGGYALDRVTAFTPAD